MLKGRTRVDGSSELDGARASLQKMLPAFQARFGEVCIEDPQYAKELVAFLQQTISLYAPATTTALRTISTPVFDFITLRFLIARTDERTEKQDIYAVFGALGIDLGGFAAFNTRLTKLKIAGKVTWPNNKQNASVEITDDGVEMCDQLATGGAGGLKREDHDFWASKLIDLIDANAATGMEA